jgi:hypothetical protein
VYLVVRLGVPDQGECQGPEGPGQCLAPPLGAAVLDFNVQLYVIVLFRIYPSWNHEGLAADTSVAREVLLLAGVRCRY